MFVSLLPRRSDVPAKDLFRITVESRSLEVVAIEVPALHVVLEGQRVDLRSSHLKKYSFGRTRFLPPNSSRSAWAPHHEAFRKAAPANWDPGLPGKAIPARTAWVALEARCKGARQRQRSLSGMPSGKALDSKHARCPSCHCILDEMSALSDPFGIT